MDAMPRLFELPDPTAWDARELHALSTLATDPLSLVAADWAAVLAPLEGTLQRLGRGLRDEYDAGRPCLPAPSRVLRALTTPLAAVRVLLVGQDPYPTPGHAVGLAFAVAPTTRPLPRSLGNIFKERQSDLGLPPSPHGDLSAWEAQGVLLLNRVLTVEAGAAGGHRGRGWEQVSDAVIVALAARRQPLVSVLWGKDAQKLRPLLAQTAVLEAAHPSPLSASRGFFGSRPFSRVNAALASQGADPIDWSLPDQPHTTAAKVRTALPGHP